MMTLEGEIHINGRTRYYKRIRALNKVRKGHYAVSTTTGQFTIEGGRHAGGTRTEWFLECQEWNKPIVCKSILDALTVIDTM
jgi:hypothetical protein